MNETQNSTAIDIEATVTRLEVEGSEEMAIAQDLARKAITERHAWVRAWHAQLLDPGKAMLRPFGEDAVGCSPGSCELVVGERVIAKFVVRFDLATCSAAIEAEWPKRKVDEAADALDRTGKHRVVYEQMARSVCWACEELGLEGESGSVDAMRRELCGRYGMRFWFEAV